MNFQDLLLKEKIDLKAVLVLRHRPMEKKLKKILPWLAMERPEVFNAYQQIQVPQVERTMIQAKYVASFIGHEPSKAIFAGLYQLKGYRKITLEEYLKFPVAKELADFGQCIDTGSNARNEFLWFDLDLLEFYNHWRGRLIIKWPPMDKNWFRWAHKPNNEMPILAILEENAFVSSMPEWYEIELTWSELKVLPREWRIKLSEWRGIYYLFDLSDGKGYVGSAYGKENLLSRWLDYASSGHGGNILLKKRNPENFVFTILQRVSPDMEAEEVIRIETSWKKRLHTFQPLGLNAN